MNQKRKVGLALAAGLLALVVLVAGITYPRPAVEVVELGYTNFTGLEVAAPTTYATGTPAVVFDSDGLGTILELRDAGTPVWYVSDGGSVTQSGAQSFSGDVTLGDAVTDNVYVYSQMRSYDGSDNWADVSSVSDLDRGNGWHAAYNVTGWGTDSSFQALFANTQVTATSASKEFFGGELKATLKAVDGSGTTTGIGVMGKVVAKTAADLPEAYGVYSRVETDGASDTINSGTNFMADLDNSGTITTSNVLATEADTWTNGVNLDAGAFTSDIILQNSETIVNSTDNRIDFGLGGSTEYQMSASKLDLLTNYLEADINSEHIMLPTVISVSVAYDGGSGTVATVADGEMWYVHAVFAEVTSNFNCTGDDCTLDIGDGTDTDGLLDLDDGELQAADTEGTGAPAGWQGFMSTDTRGAFLANGHGFIYAPSGAAETIDFAVGGTSPAAGQAYVYVVYTRFK